MSEVPAYMTVKATVLSGDPEAMLFHALQQICHDYTFRLLPNAAKARCAQHVADMLLSRPDVYQFVHGSVSADEVQP